MDTTGPNTQNIIVPPVEGIAGGGTAYGWNDGSLYDSCPLRGSRSFSDTPTEDLVHVWSVPSTTNLGSLDLPRTLEPVHVHLLAARNERESIQIALHPKVSWGGGRIAGVVQVQCTDLSSVSGDRLVSGQSITLRQVVHVLGVPDALVPIDPVSHINLSSGESTAVWVSIDVPSSQPPGQYVGEFLVTAVKAEAESASQCLSKAQKHNLYVDLKNCLETLEPVEWQQFDEAVVRATSTVSSLRRILASPSFSEFSSDNGPVDVMDEDAISNLSVRLRICLTVWDFTLPIIPSLPAVFDQNGHAFLQSLVTTVKSGDKVAIEILHLDCGVKCCAHAEKTDDQNFSISDTVIEDRFGVEHGTSEWYETLDQHFKWLLQYRISPYFCRWGQSMRVLTYTCPWPADHPKSDEYFLDPRLAAYAVPYGQPVSGYTTDYPCWVLSGKDYLQKEIEILRAKSHWKKAYFYLWDEPLNVEQFDSVRNMAREIHSYAPEARILTTYYTGPNDAPLAPTPFEAFVKVPKFLRPHTQIFCTSEWVLGNSEELAKDIKSEIQPESGEEWWTYVCMGPSDPHPNWHLGMRGTQHRAVMWRVWKEGGTGFLYWGSNCYEKATASSAEVLFRRGLPPGDGVLFYPGQVFSSLRQPIASVRLERILSGMQDYEYLNLYSSRHGRQKGLDLLDRTGVYQGPEHYTLDHRPIDAMRGEIFNSCHGP